LGGTGIDIYAGLIPPSFEDEEPQVTCDEKSKKDETMVRTNNDRFEFSLFHQDHTSDIQPTQRIPFCGGEPK
jgi:hypothetical protein